MMELRAVKMIWMTSQAYRSGALQQIGYDEQPLKRLYDLLTSENRMA